MADAGLWIFFACVLIGAGGGVLYDVLSPLRRLLVGRAPRFLAAFDGIFFVLFAAWFVFTSVLLSFPDFRAYMFFGSMLGFLFYRKSFHRILDFLFKMLYNKIKNRGNTF